MNWIKRNLFFVIGAVVSVGLLAFAGFYNYTGWRHNVEARDKRIAAYEELKRLKSQPLQPGSGKVDNIKAAREQRKAVLEVLARASKSFQSPPMIPVPTDGTNISSSQFSAALRETINELTRNAGNASVVLPPDFKFAFSQQLRLLTFAPGSLLPLASQLGEVKLLCDVLLQTKVNSLDAIQRPRVSNDDYAGPAGDYLDMTAVTNELAVLTPYRIIFRSFTPEIAQVLAGFANCPYGVVVTTIKVEPAGSLATETMPGAPPYGAYPAAVPQMMPQPQPRVMRNAAAEEAMERAMLRPDLYAMPKTAPAAAYAPPAAYPAPSPYPTPSAYPAAPGARPGSPFTVDEQPLRVELLVEVIKLLPHK